MCFLECFYGRLSNRTEFAIEAIEIFAKLSEISAPSLKNLLNLCYVIADGSSFENTIDRNLEFLKFTYNAVNGVF